MAGNKLSPYIRYSNGKAVASTLQYFITPPKNGVWRRVFTETPIDTVWTGVTGGIAGDGTIEQLELNSFKIIGPNDDTGDGWVYIKTLFTEETNLLISYNWRSDDEDQNSGFPPEFDRPIYCIDNSEPTAIPSDTDPKVNNTPNAEIWYVTVPANKWFSVGIYSADSCCGRGFLTVTLYKNCC